MAISGGSSRIPLSTFDALKSMGRSGWGRIINFSSTTGKTRSTLGGPHYTASMDAVLRLTRHMAMEEAPHGITVNAVCPGLIDTEMVQQGIDADRIRDIRTASGFTVSANLRRLLTWSPFSHRIGLPILQRRDSTSVAEI
jgi:NAD(P)-dependent dehydrogenase (short-subunit alcohol dehydrogenase family)